MVENMHFHTGTPEGAHDAERCLEASEYDGVGGPSMIGTPIVDNRTGFSWTAFGVGHVGGRLPARAGVRKRLEKVAVK